MKVQGGKLVPRSGPIMLASEQALQLKRRVVQLNPVLEGIAKAPVVVAGRAMGMPTGGRMRAAQQQAGDVVRLVLLAWKRAEGDGHWEPMVDALQNAAQRLRPLITVLEDDNRNREAEYVYELVADINRFVAAVKSGRIA